MAGAAMWGTAWPCEIRFDKARNGKVGTAWQARIVKVLQGGAWIGKEVRGL